MRATMLKMPRQPSLALFWIAIIGNLVIIQLGYNVFHQIRDIPFESNLFRVFAAIFADILSNHLLFEPLLNGLILFSIIMLCRQLIQQVKLYKKWKTYIDSKSNPEMTKRFIKKFNKENLRIEVILDSSIIAMTAGLIKPRVILSSGLIERFNDQEMEAILFHEMYHSKFRHPLQLLILTMIAESLAFLPIMKSLVHHYKIWMELLADRFAIYHMGSEIQLAQVLLAVLKNNQVKSQGYGVHFVNESVNYRLKQLIDPQTPIRIPFFKQKTLLLSVIVLVMMTLIFIYGSV
ncbi:M56 family metallopeptidase [Cohnella silvisoli]|uniref:M56 family metallopeptidase n=1 Tax=Cohnella silvisoli TaxID=2873699 RepID=A0ABV1KZS1_9BACL|nr:M56 family metallopeptidase [Cohnella silvisoli]MCD9026524.1 M56 family metallopeptidase [Cohnella silvisoli]